MITPDINGGINPAVYVEASQILSLTIATIRQSSVAAQDARFHCLEEMWAGAEKLSAAVNSYMPDMTDPVAHSFLHEARRCAEVVMGAYRAATKVDRAGYWPRIECTEIALTSKAESGNILRVWVMEKPDAIATKVHSMAFSQFPGYPPDQGAERITIKRGVPVLGEFNPGIGLGAEIKDE